MEEILTRRNTGMNHLSKIYDVKPKSLELGGFIKTDNGIEWINLFDKIILQTLAIGNPYSYFIYLRKDPLFGVNGKKRFNCFNEVVFSREEEDYLKLKDRVDVYKLLGAGI